jgi:(p)ppGpp synthase/HD superfamily hydrolase
MATLERAIVIAAEAHAGQIDKAGSPYILHPLRVMMSLQKYEEKIVGVLHDVVEDCPGWSFERLRDEGFSEEIIAGIDSVTNRPGEDYETFVRRAGSNPLGRSVKLADLQDNCDMSRISAPSEKDHARVEKYQRAIAVLGSK